VWNRFLDDLGDYFKLTIDYCTSYFEIRACISPSLKYVSKNEFNSCGLAFGFKLKFEV
jgi:hypothetical protein